MAGAPRTRGIGNRQSVHGSGIMHGHLHAFDFYHEISRSLADLLRRSLGALSQQVPNTFPLGYLGNQLHGSVSTSPFQFNAVEVLGRENALLKALHGPCQRPTTRDDIQAVVIAHLVHLDDRAHVLHHEVAAQGANSFVLRPGPFESLERAFLDVHHPLAPDDAAMAGLRSAQKGSAVLDHTTDLPGGGVAHYGP